ncbi:MAG TPA: helix-turn-helix domain-containing protein [Ohtaekwangia sp.]|uniref:winged helix-turn-helix transcriptional regulator n=1 Tax=Ohtaekwangia sp. TaxID=2066019 RepID=UPI002F935234
METLHARNEKQKEVKRLIRSVTDALYVLNGKWKLPILIALSHNHRRFGELSNDLPEITDRMLSRELRELETNLLVSRRAADDNRTKVLYEITEHGKSLHTVVLELSKWGIQHRKVIAGK